MDQGPKKTSCCWSTVHGPWSLVFCLLLVLSPWSMVHGPALAKTVDRIVAVVNNEAITEYELERAVGMRRSQMRQAVNAELALRQLREETLNDMINQKVLEHEVEKSDVQVTDDELARTIANVLQKNGINIEILRAELAAKGIPFEEYKEELKGQIKHMKFIQQHVAANIQVTDQDVQKYRANLKKAKPLDQNISVHLAVIVKKVDAAASPNDIRETVRKLRKITDKARKNADFAALAAEYSEGPEAQEGGDWGNKNLSELPSPISSLVRKMRVGAVSDPILMPEGIYIVKVLEKSVQDEAEQNQDIEALRQQIHNERMEQEFNSYIQKLRRKAYIDIRT
ncbi:MAG: SurA N-terminal domain-containing protein [Deltaproteobacteria bacterium]|nr:SurA N-terminal domain-containing protein [Deltaproteobacteria bacterium]